MNVPRFVLRCMKFKKAFLLVGIAIYGVLHYHLIRGLDSDVNNHLNAGPSRPLKPGSEQIQINRKYAASLKRASSIDYFACCGAGHVRIPCYAFAFSTSLFAMCFSDLAMMDLLYDFFSAKSTREKEDEQACRRLLRGQAT